MVWYGYVWYNVYLHIPNFVLSEYLCTQHFINLRLSKGRYNLASHKIRILFYGIYITTFHTIMSLII